MKDLKIRVNNEAESKEAQELFFELGAKKILPDSVCYSSYVKAVCLIGDCVLVNTISFESCCDSLKEITIQKLRDLVVLKRNDVGDANYKTNYGTQCYITGEDVYAFQDNKWFLSEMQHKDILDVIKPIEKPMKEYLRKNNDGEYILEVTNEREAQEPHAKHWIEIPEGAELYVDLGGVSGFYKNNFKQVWVQGNWEDTVYNSENLNIWNKVPVLWQRHTHPEELPFIDDECYTNKSDGGFRLPISEPCDISKWVEIRGDSLNDQYAEIEKVRQSHRTASETADPTIKETLSQRQEQYGSFEDVAMFTEQMVDVMRKGYYEKLAYNQKMALYMICSKMARIVNGNPNHKDSWHDIAGYATLIDNELVSEKDMPF